MLTTLALVLLASLVFGAIGLLAMRLTVTWWTGRDWLGLVYGVVGVAVAGWVVVSVLLYAGWVADILSALLVVGAGIAVVATRAWRVVSRLHVLVATLVLAVLLFDLGLLFLWQGGGLDPYEIATVRFTVGQLPIDNQIPFILANRLEHFTSTHHFIDEWNGSDRPPLQSGLILVGQIPVRPFVEMRLSSFAPSLVAQVAWVPALVGMLRSLAVPARAALVAVAVTALVPTMIINSVYTWPKALAAALVCCAVAFALDAFREPARLRRALPAAATAFALAALAHGAAVFTVPFAVGLLVLLAARHRAAFWRALPVAAIAATVLYLPWFVFQRFVDPPGDRLLRWHLGGVETIDDRSVLTLLSDSYGALDPGQLLDNKLRNLETVVFPRVWAGLVPDPAVPGPRQDYEFFHTSVALGLGLLALLALAIAAIVGAVHRRHRVSSTYTVPVLLTVPCLLVWCAVMFGPGTTVVHQGSQFWMLVLIAVPVAWVATRSRIAVGLLATGQLALTAWGYGGDPELGPLDPAAVVALAAAAGAVVLVIRGLRHLPNDITPSPFTRPATVAAS